MDGRRVAQSEVLEQTKPRASGRGGWIALALAAVLLAGGAAGLGIYANGYDRVFPGVTMGETELSGLSYQELDARLPIDQLMKREVTVTADGQELGSRTQGQLGAQVDREALRDAVWAVGREKGALGWLKNGWTMLTGWLGGGAELAAGVSGYDRAALDRAAAELAQAFDREPVDGSYTLSREGLFATKPADGQRLDQKELAEVLEATAGAAAQVEAPWEMVKAQDLDLEAMASELNAEPSAARYDVATDKVVDGQVGVSLDPEAAAFALESAVPGETVQLPAQVVYPELTAQELEAVLFRDVLSTTTTNVSGSRVRKGNVRLSGEAVNGTVLNDGDVFDYNQVVGKRTTERGYGEAATYVNGETVNTVGGGICQTSSTIYLATLLANLEIVERYNHRFYPGYITLGMDATVSWGGPEFRFKNNTGYPIRLDVSYADSKLTVSIVGTKVDDTYVKMTYSTLSTTGYETEYVESPDLAWGTQKQKQNGYVGYEVVSYRNLYKGDGTLISSTVEAKSVYKNRNQIILTGTAGRPVTPELPDFGEPAVGDAGIPAPTLPPDIGGGRDAGLPPVAPADPEPAPPEEEFEKPGWL